MPTFVVLLQQYVEKVAAVEIEAEDFDEAREAVMNGVYELGEDAIRPTWVDGTDAEPIDVYAIKDSHGEVVWER